MAESINDCERRALTLTAKAGFKQSVDESMRERFAEYVFAHEPKLRRLVSLSIDGLDELWLTGSVDTITSDAIAAASMRAIHTIPLHVIDELEIAFTTAAIVGLAEEPARVVELAKRIALLWCNAFWPFEHPAAIAQAARLGNIANALLAPVFMADLDGRITFSSHELEDLLGEPEGTVERQTMATLFNQRLNVGRDRPTRVLTTGAGGAEAVRRHRDPHRVAGRHRILRIHLRSHPRNGTRTGS